MKILFFLLLFMVSAAAATRPNILLITADDMSLHAGCYGDQLAITPHLDALAAGGALFTRAYVTHSSCSSSRASILTGFYPHRHGQIGLAGKHPEYRVKPGIPTMPVLLKNAGYHTALIGKLHISPHESFPFDYRWEEALGNPLLTRDVRKVADLSAEVFHQAGDKPFFLYLNYFDPHRPYDAESNQCQGLPENPYRAADVKPFGFLGEAAVLADVAAYYNSIRRLDAGLGFLFDELRKSGKYDNTLILFMGDNGAPFGRAKTTCYEAGVNVPFILKCPETGKPGQRIDTLVSATDILPTVLDAAGAPPVESHGRSLRGLLAGDVGDWRTAVFTETTSHDLQHFYPRRAVHEQRWKLIHNLIAPAPNPIGMEGTRPPARIKDIRIRTALETCQNPPEWELYDIAADPHEFVNLAADPAHAAELARLKKRLHTWRKESADPLLDASEMNRLHKSHPDHP